MVEDNIINYKDVKYDNKNYTIFEIKRKKDHSGLVVIDDDISKKVFCRKWHFITEDRYVSSTYYTKIREFGKKEETNIKCEIYLHNFVMGIMSSLGKGATETIDHINRIPTDNRKENLRLATQSQQNYNQKKKKRTIELPKDCGIDPNDIPRRVSYYKEKNKFGDFFEVDIKNLPDGTSFRKKTTKSKEVSLKCKLEEAKKYINEINKKYDNFLDKTNMFQDYSDKSIELIKSYNEIIKLSGFPCYESCIVPIPEKKEYVIENKENLKEEEKNLLTNVSINNTLRKKKTVNTLPPDCGITKEMIPKYCYYSPEKETRGGKFIIDRHPKLIEIKKNSWSTASSRKITIKEKFDALLEKLNELEK